ncbi:MAG: hypothetical protein K6G17_08790 [Oscillospiraceae bacterium]|nr:hypothetical protein [Oscillospiraceae bacterium]
MERLTKTLRPESAWRCSELLRALQDVAGEDAARRGGGQARLLSLGCTWVLVKNRLRLRRMPGAGEEIRLTTWPTSARFALYPRRFTVETAAGETLVTADSLWAMMDVESRRLLPGEERGLALEGVEEERFRPLRRIAVPEGGSVFTLTPAPEQIDENGHMNNAAYFDAVEPALPEELRGRPLCAAAVDYEHEILPGERVELRCVRQGNVCLLEGSAEGRACFRMELEYGE